MFISNSPRFIISKNKNYTITIVYQFLKKKESVVIDKIENIRYIIEKYVSDGDILGNETKIIIQTNIPSVKGICSRCNVDTNRFIFILNNDNKVYF